MQRRKFFKGIALASTVTLGLQTDSYSLFSENEPKEKVLIKPARLSPGDTVGLISPASGITRTEFYESLFNLESLGLKVHYSENMRVKRGYLGGTDKQRADDLNAMFANPEVKGIFCARGGYGSARILPLLNYDAIRNNPKPLVGYSDITALLNSIHDRTGLVTFHGPVGKSELTPYTNLVLKKVLMDPEASYAIPHADIFNMPAPDLKEESRRKRRLGIPPKDLNEDKPLVVRNPIFEPYIIRDGEAEGVLVGGNLTLISTLMGTPYETNFDGKLLFLEEIGEEPYRIDRMLTQLLLAGKLDKVKGIVIGVCKGCDINLSDPGYKESLSLREVLFDRLYDLDVPVVYGASFGHVPDNATLPIGIMAKLNCAQQSITLLENAVI